MLHTEVKRNVEKERRVKPHIQITISGKDQRGIIYNADYKYTVQDEALRWIGSCKNPPTHPGFSLKQNRWYTIFPNWDLFL